MKVLHLALISPDNDGMIDRGFIARGHEVKRVDWQAPDANAQAKGLSAWAEICFFQGQGTRSIATETLDHLRAKGVFVVNWTGDVRDDVEWYKAMAPHVDLTLFTNGTDIDLMREAGFRADYMQVGYNEEVYHIEGERERSGVVFMGQNSGSKFPQSVGRASMVDRMKGEFGKDFAVYGYGWGTRYLQPKEEADTYRRSLVALNWDHYQRPLFASDRLLRAQACGCAVVSHDYPGLHDEHPFVLGASDPDMMVDMVRTLLSHPEMTKETGRSSATHVRNNCQWSDRVEHLEQLIAKYR